MPTFKFSRESRYWRPKCRNRLQPETGTQRCEVCLYPEKLPPSYKCGCTKTQRPAGWPAAMNLRLSDSLGPDDIPSSALYSYRTKTLTNPAYISNPLMSPPDGPKTSVVTAEQIRKWPSIPTQTEFTVKNLQVYCPQLQLSDECVWVDMSNTQLHWKVWHPTILRGATTLQTFSIGGGSTRYFSPLEEIAPYEESSAVVSLSSNDPTSLYLVSSGQLYGITYNEVLKWEGSAKRFPEAYQTLPREFYSDPCNSLWAPGNRCNWACQPVNNYCCNNSSYQFPLPTTPNAVLAYWLSEWCLTGYYWRIRITSKTTPPYNQIWEASLHMHGGTIWTKDSVTGLQPVYGTGQSISDSIRYAAHGMYDRFPINTADRFSSSYPLSYQSSIKVEGISFQFGYSFSGGTGTPITPVNAGIPKYSGSLAKVLAIWEGPWSCTDSGEVELTLTEDYRSILGGTAIGGPTTFPQYVYLNVESPGTGT